MMARNKTNIALARSFSWEIPDVLSVALW